MRLKRSLILASLVFFPLLVGTTNGPLVGQVRTYVIGFTRPFLELQTQLILVSRKQFLRVLEWTRLREENEALRKALKDVNSKRSEFEELKREQVRLRALLALKDEESRRTTAARVIGRDPSHWARFVIINKGSRDGVLKNTVLIHPDGLVGKVVASGAHSARSILLIDRESRVSAMNQRTRDIGLIEGQGRAMLKMTYLDRASQIQVGDVILSSGLGEIYPKGIPIGKVELVGEEPDRLSLYALVKPFAPFSRLEEVLCLFFQTGG